MDRLIPPIRGAGAAVALKLQMRQKNQAKQKEAAYGMNVNKTFFKGATSFIMQAESTMKMDQNDSTIRSCLGIEN